ncbi:MAG: hypothetical protein ALAOOOJD_02544 [bacterium]|nr:hypothetical protein [bacterium]
MHRFPEIISGLAQRFFIHQCQRFQVELITDAGSQFSNVLCFIRQPLNFARHQLDHVVRHAHTLNAPKLKLPVAVAIVKFQQFFLMQCLQKLGNEERIAGGFLQHQLGKWQRLFSRTP